MIGGSEAGGRDGPLLPALGLLAVTAVFGWTFVVVKYAISHYPLLGFLGLRFGLAAAVLLLLERSLPSLRTWRGGFVIGLVLALGYLAQTEGMRFVPPGVAGLLTGLFVVFTPLLDWVFFRQPIRLITALAVVVAIAGTALLTGVGRAVSVGDALLILGALAFAAQIVLLSHSRLPVGELSSLQMLSCAVLFLALGAGVSRAYPAPSPLLLGALLVTGILASSVAVVVQTWAQRRMSASRAGLLLAAEPGFALLFAAVLTGERLSLIQGMGALLLLVAILGHEALPLLRASE